LKKIQAMIITLTILVFGLKKIKSRRKSKTTYFIEGMNDTFWKEQDTKNILKRYECLELMGL